MQSRVLFNEKACSFSLYHKNMEKSTNSMFCYCFILFNTKKCLHETCGCVNINKIDKTNKMNLKLTDR